MTQPTPRTRPATRRAPPRAGPARAADTRAAAVVAQARIDTPLGPMTAAATPHGLAGLWFDDQRHHPGPLAAPVDEGNPFIQQTRHELTAYFARQSGAGRGRGPAFGGFTVPLDPQGTPFQKRVWQRLMRIGDGQCSHYAELARRLGSPEAARAVGAAVGRNPISIIVPCHRVLGRDGSLTGYAGGLARKNALLQLEGARAGAAEPEPEPERSAA
ncbi:MAG: methylated-DNA--[protein]-cysteine S-methyltransferase [Rubrivivax sp.]|nr:methylated-DNA--[protein]-cysteine S-methyltransferase [Rubrivivax sp.]